MEHQPTLTRDPADLSRSTALRFVIFLGVVSLFADMTYEGARSITGPYLAILGASGMAVGFVAGVGELLGYASASSPATSLTGRGDIGRSRSSATA